MFSFAPSSLLVREAIARAPVGTPVRLAGADSDTDLGLVLAAGTEPSLDLLGRLAVRHVLTEADGPLRRRAAPGTSAQPRPA